ncbi:hypothetical protein NUW54_g4614 [Trametes sanguinea]|uniref:Uncharacterized protein n=1 Tax=Trametes sanguinea TaxID=158606 RepID=A0ACC1PYP4_9APHY|nr:hypothetical protein NUW54_g4614 [Trametes sanguinea]
MLRRAGAHGAGERADRAPDVPPDRGAGMPPPGVLPARAAAAAERAGRRADRARLEPGLVHILAGMLEEDRPRQLQREVWQILPTMMGVTVERWGEKAKGDA